MKRFVLSFVFIFSSVLCVFAQQTISVEPLEIIRLPQIKHRDLQVYDDSNGSAVGPYYEVERGLVFIMQNGIYRFDDNFEPHFTEIPTYDAWAGGGVIVSSRSYTLASGIGFRIQRHGDLYSDRDTYQRFGLVGNSILIDNMVVREDGTSLVIDPDLTIRVLDRTATLEYAKTNIPDATVVGPDLYYRGNKIGRNYIEMIDDDGNFYSARTLYRNGSTFNKIDLKLAEPYYRLYDHEGNILAIRHSPDGVIVFYAGRTWGYQQPARKATVTANNLRIRLRANTDSFVLGRVQAAEQITVLKIGPTATIGGQTAPWYRIQTAAGLVGWVFGSFVEIEE